MDERAQVTVAALLRHVTTIGFAMVLANEAKGGATREEVAAASPRSTAMRRRLSRIWKGSISRSPTAPSPCRRTSRSCCCSIWTCRRSRCTCCNDQRAGGYGLRSSAGTPRSIPKRDWPRTQFFRSSPYAVQCPVIVDAVSPAAWPGAIVVSASLQTAGIRASFAEVCIGVNGGLSRCKSRGLTIGYQRPVERRTTSRLQDFARLRRLARVVASPCRRNL
jgi:hypothetical protein